jgi:hypothetical protein
LSFQATRGIFLDFKSDAVGVFSSDETIPEDGLRIVIENFRKSMKIARQVALNEVSDTNPLREAQRELGIKK